MVAVLNFFFWRVSDVESQGSKTAQVLIGRIPLCFLPPPSFLPPSSKRSSPSIQPKQVSGYVGGIGQDGQSGVG